MADTEREHMGSVTTTEPMWLDEDCPGGLPWTSCHADDCGVLDDGTGCDLSDE